LGEGRPVSATPRGFATRKYADAVLRRVDFDAKDGHQFAVIPGWSEGPDPESQDCGFASSTRPE
jgi:hypothetical protein